CDVVAEVFGQTFHQRAMVLVGEGADVDADRGAVGHRVDVEAPGDRADVEGGRPEHWMRSHIEGEALELRHRASRLVDGVDAALGHRSVGGYDGRPRIAPAR